MALGRWCRYYGLEILKEGRTPNKFFSTIKFFRTRQELEGYLEKYIYSRPANAKKVYALNRFIAETKEITSIYNEKVKT